MVILPLAGIEGITSMREQNQAGKLLAKFYAGRDQFALVEHSNQTLSIARNGQIVMVWPAAAQDDCVRTFMRLIDAQVASGGCTDLLVLSGKRTAHKAQQKYLN